MKAKQLNNRQKSKNNLGHGKPKNVKVDWPTYNKGRMAEILNRNKCILA